MKIMKTRITVITDVLLFLLSFIMFSLSMLSMKYFSNSVTIFQRIMGNANSDPLEDIVAVRWQCPTDYEPLFNFTYGGLTQDGCYCPDKQKVISNLDCTYFINTPGYESCIPWKKQQDSILKVWQNKTLCFKAYNMSNVDKVIVSNIEDCPITYTNCGYYDIYKDKLCLRPVGMDIHMKCPINYINFINTSDINVTDTSVKYLVLSDEKTLVFSRSKINSFIPTDFIVSEGPPCVLLDRISNYSAYFPYANVSNTLLGCNPFTTGNNELYYDSRYSLLDTYQADKFFNDNDQIYLNELPDIPGPSWIRNTSMAFNLYYKSYIRMNADCVSDADYSYFMNFLTTSRTLQFYLLVVYLVNMIVLGIFNSILLLMKLTSKIQNIIVSLLKIVFCILVSCASIYIVFNAFQIDELAANFESKIISNDDCLDSTTKFLYSGYYQVKTYVDYFSQFNSILSYCSIVYAVLVAVQLLRFTYKSFFRIRKKFEKKDNKKASSINK